MQLRMAILVSVCIAALSAFSQSNPSIRFKVELQGDVSCGKSRAVVRGRESWWILVPLRVDIENTSDKKIIVGRVTVVNEQIYHRLSEGKIVTFRTTTPPDELGVSFVPGDGFPDVIDEELSSGEHRAIEVREYVYLVLHDTQIEKGMPMLRISFRIVNLRHNGEGDNYWSDPMLIPIPARCGFQ